MENLFENYDLIEIIYGDSDDFEILEDEKITEQSRWSTYYEMIVKHLISDTCWSLTWSRGSTEMQDEGVEDILYNQVWPVEITKIEYTNVNPEKERK